jgi:hypothetical protein
MLDIHQISQEFNLLQLMDFRLKDLSFRILLTVLLRSTRNESFSFYLVALTLFILGLFYLLYFFMVNYAC